MRGILRNVLRNFCQMLMLESLLFGLRMRFKASNCSPLAYFENVRRIRLGAHVTIDSLVVLKGGKREGAQLIIGDGCLIRRNCYISATHGQIDIGNSVLIAHNTWIAGHGTIKIGRETIIGPNVVLISSNHDIASSVSPMKDAPEITGMIHIGERCWLGANVTVVPNVEIGAGSIIGAGCVVVNDVPANAIAVGNPARVLDMPANEALSLYKVSAP